jgi:hypothetical protein
MAEDESRVFFEPTLLSTDFLLTGHLSDVTTCGTGFSLCAIPTGVPALESGGIVTTRSQAEACVTWLDKETACG